MPPWIMCDEADDAPDTKSLALDEHDVDALEREVSEGGDAVDAAADHEHLGPRPVAERGDIRPDAAVGTRTFASVLGGLVRRHRGPLDAERRLA